MMSFNYKYPEGREYVCKKESVPKEPVKIRFLTAEERKAYGCDDRVVVKKRCCQCGKVKSDYQFLPGKGSADGLSPRCRKCVEETGSADGFLYSEDFQYDSLRSLYHQPYEKRDPEGR